MLLSPSGRRGMVIVRPKKGAIEDLLWSPDGRYLAYTRLRHPDLWPEVSRLMVYDIRSGQSGRVGFGGSRSVARRGYTWISPTELVVSTFRRRDDDGHMNGFLVRCDVRRGACRPLTDGSGTPLVGVTPTASEDGRRLAFVTFTDRKPSGSLKANLLVLDVDDGRVWTAATIDDYYEAGCSLDHPVISLDGRWVFAAATASDVGFVPSIYGVDGSVQASRRWGQMFGGAAWDPADPGHVVYAGAHGLEHVRGGLFAWRAGTRRIVNGMRISGLVSGIGWSPTGIRIAYLTAAGGSSSLWVASRDGGERHRVARGVGAPAWARVVLPRAR